MHRGLEDGHVRRTTLDASMDFAATCGRAIEILNSGVDACSSFKHMVSDLSDRPDSSGVRVYDILDRDCPWGAAEDAASPRRLELLDRSRSTKYHDGAHRYDSPARVAAAKWGASVEGLPGGGGASPAGCCSQSGTQDAAMYSPGVLAAVLPPRRSDGGGLGLPPRNGLPRTPARASMSGSDALLPLPPPLPAPARSDSPTQLQQRRSSTMGVLLDALAAEREPATPWQQQTQPVARSRSYARLCEEAEARQGQHGMPGTFGGGALAAVTAAAAAAATASLAAVAAGSDGSGIASPGTPPRPLPRPPKGARRATGVAQSCSALPPPSLPLLYDPDSPAQGCSAAGRTSTSTSGLPSIGMTPGATFASPAVAPRATAGVGSHAPVRASVSGRDALVFAREQQAVPSEWPAIGGRRSRGPSPARAGVPDDGQGKQVAGSSQALDDRVPAGLLLPIALRMRSRDASPLRPAVPPSAQPELDMPAAAAAALVAQPVMYDSPARDRCGAPLYPRMRPRVSGTGGGVDDGSSPARPHGTLRDASPSRYAQDGDASDAGCGSGSGGTAYCPPPLPPPPLPPPVRRSSVGRASRQRSQDGTAAPAAPASSSASATAGMCLSQLGALLAQQQALRADPVTGDDRDLVDEMFSGNTCSRLPGRLIPNQETSIRNARSRVNSRDPSPGGEGDRDRGDGAAAGARSRQVHSRNPSRDVSPAARCGMRGLTDDPVSVRPTVGAPAGSSASLTASPATSRRGTVPLPRAPQWVSPAGAAAKACTEPRAPADDGLLPRALPRLTHALLLLDEDSGCYDLAFSRGSLEGAGR